MPPGSARIAPQVLLVARVHPTTKNARVNLREKVERIFPRIHPVEFSVRPFDQPVQRRDQGRDDLSHVRAPTDCAYDSVNPSVFLKWDAASATAFVTWLSWS